MKKEIVIVDVQSHFLQYERTNEDNNKYIDDIFKFLGKNQDKINTITVVVDKNFEDNGEETFLEEELDLMGLDIDDICAWNDDLEEYNELDEDIVALIIQHRIPFQMATKLIDIQNNTNISINYIDKNYGYLRDSMDENIEKTAPIIQIKNVIHSQGIDSSNLSTDELTKLLTSDKKIQSIINYTGFDIEELAEWIENDRYYPENELSKYETILKSNNEIVVFGGESTACLLEELCSLHGLKDFLKTSSQISVEKNLVYGPDGLSDQLSDFKSSFFVEKKTKNTSLNSKS